MGCSISSPKTYSRAPIIPLDFEMEESQLEAEQKPLPPPGPPIGPIDFKEDLKVLLQGVSKIPYVSNAQTFVIISDKSSAVYTAPLFFPNGDGTTINLPIMTCSKYFYGRFFLIGSLDIILKCVPQKTDASVFLENLIRWSSGDRSGIVKLGILGLSPEHNTIIKKNAEGFGFKVKTNLDDKNIPKVHCILTTSLYKKVHIIQELLNQGIGVIMCYQQPLDKTQNTEIYSDLFYQMGMPLSQCNLIVGDQNSDFFKSISHKELLKLNLHGLITKFQKIVKHQPIDTPKLDSLCTLICFHCTTIREVGNELIDEIYSKMSEYLFTLDCLSNNVVCPQIEAKIIAVLITQIIDKVSPTKFVNIDLSESFPGKTGNVTVATYKIELIPTYEWISTGIFLPPGIIASIDTDKPLDCQLSVQIGSNPKNLLTIPDLGSWKRWPIVTQTYPLIENHFEFSSLFGGIVYFLFESNDTPISPIEITVSNVCRYPRFFIMPQNDNTTSITNTAILASDEDNLTLSLTSTGDISEIHNEMWEQTKDIDVPLGEIETETIVFTAPSSYLRSIPNISKFAMKYHSLVRRIFSLTALDLNKQVRVIYEVDTFESCSSIDCYPYYVTLDTLQKYINYQEPSKQLFDLLSHVAFLSLPEDYFSPEVEMSMAFVASCAVMKEEYPNCDPLIYMNETPGTIFTELWKIYNTYDKSALTIAFLKIRSFKHKDLFSINDMWGRFVQEYESALKIELPQLKTNSNPGKSSSRLKGITTSESLSAFIVSNKDIEVMK